MAQTSSTVSAQQLLATANRARLRAYAPYSHFSVGAALLGESGTVYLGCNIENAAFGPTNCAERTAIFTAVAQGERKFRAIAIVGGPAHQSSTPGSETDQPSTFCPPCGVCRQVLREFVDPETFQLFFPANRNFTLAQLLPHSFGPAHLSTG
jgi:cytidine deaminase